MNNIHATAIVDENAKLGSGITIGPYCTIGPNVSIGDGCTLISHVVLEGHTTIGKENRFHPFSIIGADPGDLKYQDEDTTLVIGNGNTFRESCSAHRGTVTGGGETRIGNDNLFMGYVHIAHDCIVGDRNVLATYVGLSGHVVIDNNAILGGQTGVVQFLRIGSFAYIGGASVIDKNIPPYSTGYGNRISIKGVNIVGLKRAGYKRDVISSIAEAHRVYFRSGLSEAEAIQRIEAELGEVEEVQNFLGFLRATGGKVH